MVGAESPASTAMCRSPSAVASSNSGGQRGRHCRHRRRVKQCTHGGPTPTAAAPPPILWSHSTAQATERSCCRSFNGFGDGGVWKNNVHGAWERCACKRPCPKLCIKWPAWQLCQQPVHKLKSGDRTRTTGTCPIWGSRCHSATASERPLDTPPSPLKGSEHCLWSCSRIPPPCGWVFWVGGWGGGGVMKLRALADPPPRAWVCGPCAGQHRFALCCRLYPATALKPLQKRPPPLLPPAHPTPGGLCENPKLTCQPPLHCDRRKVFFGAFGAVDSWGKRQYPPATTTTATTVQGGRRGHFTPRARCHLRPHPDFLGHFCALTTLSALTWARGGGGHSGASLRWNGGKPPARPPPSWRSGRWCRAVPASDQPPPPPPPPRPQRHHGTGP